MTATRFAPSTNRELARRLTIKLDEAVDRSRTLRTVADQSLVELDVSDVLDNEASDAGLAEHAHAIAIAVENDHTMAEIRAALHRLAIGEYGLCERCAAPIPLVRLRAIPETRWCVRCSHQLSSLHLDLSSALSGTR